MDRKAVRCGGGVLDHMFYTFIHYLHVYDGRPFEKCEDQLLVVP